LGLREGKEHFMGAEAAEEKIEIPAEGTVAGGAEGGTKTQPSVDPKVDAGAAGTASEPDDDPLGVSEKDGKKFIKMPFEKFKEKIGKETRKALREMFGTADEKSILAIKKKVDEFEKEAEERKRAELSERQLIERDRDDALSAKEVAERRAARAVDRVERQRVHRKMESIAKGVIASERVDDALVMFRAHVAGLSRKRVDKLKGHEKEWFEEFASKRPEYAKVGTKTAEASETETKDEKKPASNGVDPKKAAKPPATAPTTKKVADMSPAELRDYAAKNGIKLPSEMRFV
jgi:hypothetical protein